eukprot:4472779-Lingulodinium_polyedra.AAC.1
MIGAVLGSMGCPLLLCIGHGGPEDPPCSLPRPCDKEHAECQTEAHIPHTPDHQPTNRQGGSIALFAPLDFS